MKYKVLIASAGLGNRLKGMTKNINKALVSISHKPAISYIIEKIPENIEIVIAIGYKGGLVRDYIKINYPNRKITFIDVDKYEGDGSGLGYSILKCENELQCPFIFTSNDTIVLEKIPEPSENWIGHTNLDDNSKYRSITSENGVVKSLNPKGFMGDSKTYIGLCGINDYKLFWESMNKGYNQGAIEIGESYGLRALIKKGIKPINFTWFDTGNVEKLNITREYFNKNEYNILEKEEEAIWFQKDKVIKFSIDNNFIKNRVIRSKFLEGYIPEIISYSNNMYSYNKVEGEIFSKNPDPIKFNEFLGWMKNFWISPKIRNTTSFNEICHSFYYDKTYERIKKYFTVTESKDNENIINSVTIPATYSLLEKINWDNICSGIPVRFHGDLHFENILVNYENELNKFSLLDWRQDFGGELFYGDIYYDFAKLNHGLIISHQMVDKNLFDIQIQGNNVYFSFYRDEKLIDCEKFFDKWLIENGYDIKKVKIMTALIFLNIAALHHNPYNKLLYFLGKSMLHENLL